MTATRSLATGLVAALIATGSGSTAARSAPASEGTHAAVATDQRLATETGIRILREGGNAVDAAVAIGYTLAVTFPAAGNIGGGGFMLIRTAKGATHFVDFRETAPGAATAGMYLDSKGDVVPDRSIDGALSAGIPGSVAGLELARATYGTLPRHELLKDAIAYASTGFTLSDADADILSRAHDRLAAFPASAAIFTRPAYPARPAPYSRNRTSPARCARSTSAARPASIPATSRSVSSRPFAPAAGSSRKRISRRIARSIALRSRARTTAIRS